MTKRPIIKVTRSRLDLTVEIISATVLITAIALLLFYYPTLPERVPSHYDALGQPDSYSSKSKLIILVGIGIFLYALLTVISRFPHIFNYPVNITETNAESQYVNSVRMLRYIKLVIICQFTYIVYASIMIALGTQATLGVAFLPVSLAFLFGVMIIFIVRAYRQK